jgi:predicted nucleic acid-binding protein
MYILDTNVLSELRRRDKAHPGVAAWADAVDQRELYLSVITVLEVEMGILALARRDQAQSAVLGAWLKDRVLPAFAGRILPIDVAVAQRCAQLHVPDPRAERDALIAATALTHRMAVVTRNVADFKPMGVVLLNPWEGSPG